MFIVSLHYIRPLTDIEANLEAHRSYLQHYYDTGKFVMSGRKEPRTGGIILVHAENRAEVEAIIAQDPFHQVGVAEYEITEFLPSKTAPGLEAYQQR